jgi:hypothetical protein
MGSSFIWIVQKYLADRNVSFVDHPQIWLGKKPNVPRSGSTLDIL